ncbi:MAG: hypothetical protein H7X91_12140 [Burkholderiales bacterium]|nr:hypothetical protein [Burkholderiales bacterium]
MQTHISPPFTNRAIHSIGVFDDDGVRTAADHCVELGMPILSWSESGAGARSVDFISTFLRSIGEGAMPMQVKVESRRISFFSGTQIACHSKKRRGYPECSFGKGKLLVRFTLGESFTRARVAAISRQFSIFDLSTMTE